ncbi:MAG: YbaK/EbsC family protein [Candidatus Nanohaloarchaea archaeon]|nr:YbaK/EbsC family protein [Candidatus Nanohaloarchaea archaeon]
MSAMLEQFCEENGIEAEFIQTDGSESAEDAARALNTTVEHIIKSLVFYADGDPVLVIVRGCDHVSEEKVAETLRAEQCRLAQPAEVEDETGFGVGAVPPVGADLDKLVDEAILEMDEVYGGGGAPDRVIGLDPRFIVGEDDLVADVTV